jgi:hypothetical protein
LKPTRSAKEALRSAFVRNVLSLAIGTTNEVFGKRK